MSLDKPDLYNLLINWCAWSFKEIKNMTLKFLFTKMIRDISMAVSNQGYLNVFHFFLSAYNGQACYYNRKIEKTTLESTQIVSHYICYYPLQSYYKAKSLFVGWSAMPSL